MVSAAKALIGEVTGELRPCDLEPRWYAAYTCANHEKRIAEQLHECGIEHFLPLCESVHRWKDRRVRVELPLFPGYVFVRLPLRERLRVLQLPSVVRLVGFGERPVALPEAEIETLRMGLRSELRAQPHPYLTRGRRVRITRGPLSGLEGVLVRRKGNCRVVLAVDLILRSIAVDVDAGEVIPVGKPAMWRESELAEGASEWAKGSQEGELLPFPKPPFSGTAVLNVP
jgi:transcription antitermination factor NusG